MLALAMMFQFIKYLLSVFGATELVMAFAEDFNYTKRGEYQPTYPMKRKPFTCSLCMGFYFGSIFIWFFSTDIPTAIVCSFAAAGSTYALHRMVTGEY